MLNLSNMPLATFQAIVRQIASENPDRVYKRKNAEDEPSAPNCLYRLSLMKDGTMSRCILGEALYRLGLIDEELPGEGVAFSVLKRYNASADVRGWASTVQIKQDSGKPWSEAAQ